MRPEGHEPSAAAADGRACRPGGATTAAGEAAGAPRSASRPARDLRENARATGCDAVHWSRVRGDEALEALRFCLCNVNPTSG